MISTYPPVKSLFTRYVQYPHLAGWFLKLSFSCVQATSFSFDALQSRHGNFNLSHWARIQTNRDLVSPYFLRNALTLNIRTIDLTHFSQLFPFYKVLILTFSHYSFWLKCNIYVLQSLCSTIKCGYGIDTNSNCYFCDRCAYNKGGHCSCTDPIVTPIENVSFEISWTALCLQRLNVEHSDIGMWVMLVLWFDCFW